MMVPPTETPLDENEGEFSEEALDRLEPIPEDLEENGYADEEEEE